MRNQKGNSAFYQKKNASIPYEAMENNHNDLSAHVETRKIIRRRYYNHLIVSHLVSTICFKLEKELKLYKQRCIEKSKHQHEAIILSSPFSFHSASE